MPQYMSRAQRDREKSCGGKVSYKTEQEAETAVIYQREFYGHKLEAYRCRYCQSWHLGTDHG